jgi:dephospho-CoA kinase
MAIIGITGSICSGKTELLSYLAKQKHIVFSCDTYVKELYKDPVVVKEIEKNFPELQKLIKLSLAKIIYSDSKKRKKLESILHPLAAKGLEKFLGDNAQSQSSNIFLEIPLLFEAGFDKYCDYIITLCCPPEVRLARALERGLTEEMFESIDKAQMPEELKVEKSDFVIDTNVDWEEEIAEFHSVMKRI